MPLYELSIDGARVREASRVVSLEGRGFPTLVMRWDMRILDQPWQTTLVLDYLIALPPLMQGTFNEVKIAAFVGGASTKFMYFGTEMSAAVPRLGPEMENSIAPAGAYQEFRLEEATCPLPYLKLIAATPRIYGPGPQDYYSPPIKVERYDATVSSDQIADFFPVIVANLDPVGGDWLTDPQRGLWNGARFVGATKIAVLRDGKVVGMLERLGKTDKDAPPPEVKRRDPKLDVVKSIVAIDVGASTTVVAERGDRSQAELVRIGPVGGVATSADYETPSEVSFVDLSRTVKAWRDRVILPATRWDDVRVGFAAREQRKKAGPDQLARAAATLTNLSMLRDRTDRNEGMKLRGLVDPEAQEVLKKPAPPVIDEDGIGAHDPFDPIELFAYYVGLTINQRKRGIHLRYAVSMPMGWSPERRQSVLIAFRRGLFRSLPAGLVEYHDLEQLEVVDAGPSALAFTAQALRVFNIQPKLEPIPLATIDAGASETGFFFGVLRNAKPEERGAGHERMIEYLEPVPYKELGGERVLARFAHRVFLANEAAFAEARAPVDRPPSGEHPPEDETLVVASPEARANTTALKDVVRSILEGTPGAMPTKLKLANEKGEPVDVQVDIDRAKLDGELEAAFEAAAKAFKAALEGALAKIGRDPDPYDGLRVLLGGRVATNARFADAVQKLLPPNVQVHRFKEPDKSNLAAPTVKTATALGILAMRFEKIGAALRAEKRDAFKYRVGRARHGQLADVLDPSVDYDLWREVGAATKPEVEVLYMAAESDGEVAADDPRVKKAVCALGASIVGKRLYMRAVGAAKVEVSAGPPGGDPEKGAPVWSVDLATGAAAPV